jgi:hypothetical protein
VPVSSVAARSVRCVSTCDGNALALQNSALNSRFKRAADGQIASQDCQSGCPYLAEREALLGAVRTHDVQALGARELDVVTEVDAGDAPEAFLACLRVVLQQREEEEGERACDRLGRGGRGDVGEKREGGEEGYRGRRCTDPGSVTEPESGSPNQQSISKFGSQSQPRRAESAAPRPPAAQ